MNVTLIYLDYPFWRIELARIPLFIGDISFNDKRITLEEFRSAKETGFLKDGTKLPFHQIPCLVVDGVPIADEVEMMGIKTPETLAAIREILGE